MIRSIIVCLGLFSICSQGHSTTYIKEYFENSGWGKTIYGKGYGASTAGAQQDAIRKCQNLVQSHESKCQGENGNYTAQECVLSGTSFNNGVYISSASSPVSCVTGQYVYAWKASSIVKNPNDFVAVDTCREEIKQLALRCHGENGDVHVTDRCAVSHCNSDECVAVGQLSCL